MLRVYISNVFFLDKGYFPLKAFIEGVCHKTKRSNGFCKYYLVK